MNAYLITEATTDVGKKIVTEIMKKQEKVSFIFPVKDTSKARQELSNCISEFNDVNMIFCECPKGTEDATLDRFSFKLKLTQIIACPLEFEDDKEITIIEKTKKINKSAINVMELAKVYNPQNVLYILKNDMDNNLNMARQFAVHYCKLYEKEYGINNIYIQIENSDVLASIISGE